MGEEASKFQRDCNDTRPDEEYTLHCSYSCHGNADEMQSTVSHWTEFKSDKTNTAKKIVGLAIMFVTWDLLFKEWLSSTLNTFYAVKIAFRSVVDSIQ